MRPKQISFYFFHFIFEESSFTFRRGRLPPIKSTSAPSIGTSPTSVEDEEIGGIDIGTDIGIDIAGDIDNAGDIAGDLEDDESNLFYQGQRLIPNHVFESPSLPIRQQVSVSVSKCFIVL